MKTLDILSTFLTLTQKTYPAGKEDQLKKYLPKGIKKDKAGNYFIKIGTSTTVFTCHLDTYGDEQESITHHVAATGYVFTDGFTILGADDKAGMTIMLYMIHHNIPGLYYFFIKEEIGGVGSKEALQHHTDLFSNYQRMISFDRSGTHDVITEQKSGRCCSDFFALALCEALNQEGLQYQPSPHGYFTDSDRFINVIPECTNISVGYYDEHTVDEHLDYFHLQKLAQACVFIEWELLPTLRCLND